MLYLYKIDKTYYSILIAGLYIIISVIHSHIFMSETNNREVRRKRPKR
jgi:hypothetical protein